MQWLRFAGGLIAGAAVCRAQSKPLTLSAQCSMDMVQNLSLNCSTEEPCPLYLELASAEAVASRMVLTGNIHTAGQTVESVLLVSDDGGRTWTEAHSRIPGTVLDQIQFLDFEAGWVSGHFLQTTPKDAFLLLTTDGGKTWRRRPVSSESRTGAVDQFWFDSRNHGLLSIDRVRAAENGLRYELWESHTGGESWSIRQVDSKPVPFSRPARDNGLRIRSDASGKTHHVERRDGSRWTTIAVFAVSAGECKPPQPTVQEAVPPPEEPAAPEPTTPKPVPGPRKPPSLRK